MNLLQVFWPLLVAAVVLLALYRYLKMRKPGSAAYQWAVRLSLLGAFLLFWINGAVGIIGSGNNDANMLYLVIFAIGLLGGLVVNFQAQGMARVLVLAAAVQVLIPVISIAGRIDITPPGWQWDVAILTVFFTALWLLSARLFWMASRSEADREAR